MRVASVDIGKRNFAIAIEDRELDCKKIHLLRNVDLVAMTIEPSTHYDWCRAMTLFLDEHKELLSQCDYLVIEQQMAFGRKTNICAIKLAQHCASYMLCRYPQCKVVDFPAHLKLSILQGTSRPIKMTKPQRKKYCIEQALAILESRDDNVSIQIIRAASKKDDLGDVICQMEAFHAYLKNKKRSENC